MVSGNLCLSMRWEAEGALKKMMDARLPLYDEEQLKSWKVVFKMILNGITTG